MVICTSIENISSGYKVGEGKGVFLHRNTELAHLVATLVDVYSGETKKVSLNDIFDEPEFCCRVDLGDSVVVACCSVIEGLILDCFERYYIDIMPVNAKKVLPLGGVGFHYPFRFSSSVEVTGVFIGDAHSLASILINHADLIDDILLNRYILYNYMGNEVVYVRVNDLDRLKFLLAKAVLR